MTTESCLYLRLRRLSRHITTSCCSLHRIHQDSMVAERLVQRGRIDPSLFVQEWFANFIVLLTNTNKFLLYFQCIRIVWSFHELVCFCHINQVLSRAFRNRFIELHYDEIPPPELETILHQRCQLPLSYCKKLVSVLLDLQVRFLCGTHFKI